MEHYSRTLFQNYNDVIRKFIKEKSKKEIKDDIQYLKNRGFIIKDRKTFGNIKLTHLSIEISKLYNRIDQCKSCKKYYLKKQIQSNLCKNCIDKMGDKRCLKCGEIKTKSEFYCYNNIFLTRCKKCLADDKKLHIEKNREKVRKQYREAYVRRREYHQNYKKTHKPDKISNETKRRKKLLKRIYQ